MAHIKPSKSDTHSLMFLRCSPQFSIKQIGIYKRKISILRPIGNYSFMMSWNYDFVAVKAPGAEGEISHQCTASGTGGMLLAERHCHDLCILFPSQNCWLAQFIIKTNHGARQIHANLCFTVLNHSMQG